MSAKPAVVLLSGGLDSATCLAMAKDRGFEPNALTIVYGQRHALEVEAAGRVAEHIGTARHVVSEVNPGLFAGSALTDDVPVPKGRDEEAMASEIPVTYVPARNTIFLSMALAWAESLGCGDIFIGVNAVDYSGYPDCRPEYIEAFTHMANLAVKEAVEGRLQFTVHAPLVEMTKAEIIKIGSALGVDFGLTWSCYDPRADEVPCGECDSCVIRARGFRTAGLADPLLKTPE